LPITPKVPLTPLGRRCFGLEIEYPAGYEAAHNRDIGHDYSYVVLDVINAVVDWVCPIGLEEREKAVAIR
jgi:hypothetical protein